jgi:hypothetical protein
MFQRYAAKWMAILCVVVVIVYRFISLITLQYESEIITNRLLFERQGFGMGCGVKPEYQRTAAVSNH